MIFGGSTKLQVDHMTWRLVIYIHCAISIAISIGCCWNWPLVSLLASIVFKVSFRAKRCNLLRVVLQQYQSCLRLLMTLDKLDSFWKKNLYGMRCLWKGWGILVNKTWSLVLTSGVTSFVRIVDITLVTLSCVLKSNLGVRQTSLRDWSCTNKCDQIYNNKCSEFVHTKSSN